MSKCKLRLCYLDDVVQSKEGIKWVLYVEDNGQWKTGHIGHFQLLCLYGQFIWRLLRTANIEHSENYV